MSIQGLRTKIHEMVDKIEDEETLSVLAEDVALYTSSDSEIRDEPNQEQWSAIQRAKEQIKNGDYKTFEEVKQHFSQWLTK